MSSPDLSSLSVKGTPAAMITILPDEMLMEVLAFLDPTDVLKTVICCSRQVANAARSDQLWRYKYGKIFSIPPILLSSLTTKQLQQCCILAFTRNTCRDWFARNQGRYLWPKSLFRTIENALGPIRSKEGCLCLCSTRDRDGPHERIENVLSPGQTAEEDWEQIVAGNPRYISMGNSMIGQFWWSSAPNQHRLPEETNETLLFTTNEKAIVTEVAIKPLTEPFLFDDSNRTTFSWPRISIKVYLLPQKDNSPLLITSDVLEGDKDEHGSGNVCGDWVFNTRSSDDLHLDQRAIINAVLSGYTPTYESPVMDAKSFDNSWQCYKIPDGVVGNVITFTLWGKHFEQFPQSGYYVCVERVAARGIPLITA